jgi:O-antigen ligase
MSLGDLRRQGDQWMDRSLYSATEKLARVPRPVFDILVMTIGAAALIYLFVERSPVYGVGFVVALFAVLFLLTRPIVLTYALFAFIPIYWLNLLGESLRVITVLTLFGFAYHIGRVVLTRDRVPWNRVYLGYALFLVSCALSLANSNGIVEHSYPAMKYFVLSLLFMLVITMSVRTERDLKTLFWILVGWGVVESVLGVLQTFVSDRFYFQSTFESVIEAYSVGDVRRASGTFQVGPRYAMFLMAPVAIVVAGLLSGRVLRRRTWLLLLAPLVAGVFLSLTRVAVVLSLFYVVVYNFYERRRQAFVASVVGFALAGVLVLAVTWAIPGRAKDALRARFSNPEEEVYMDRLFFLWNALGAFTEHPLLGIGVGAYESRSLEFMQKYPVPWRRYRWSISERWNLPQSVPVHNQYGRMLAEQGFFSVPIFLFLCLSAFRNLRYVRRRSASDFVRLWSVATSMYLSMLMIYIYFHEYFLDEPYVSIIPFTVSVLLYNHVRRQEAEHTAAEAADAAPA